ncbi:DCC1-like thiol-disulfide oxidoreductase family protein [Streptomyces sp. NPDC006193]|uniref:thiol-disulfide oxidoreductase DCC family protein n=1 Tax=Streptomyces sp. NPDC006193 TaxID=3155717 RepID=UPI0033ADE438
MTGTQDRGAARVPVRALTVLYDAECGLCTHLRRWLARQPQLVPLEPVPAGSAAARARFPRLDHAGTLEEITVVGDSGQVYRGPHAWIVVLWALREHRPLAHRLATPAGLKLARGAVLAAARWRAGPRRGTRWGGRAYHRADGWSYHPATGWVHDPPSCSGAGRGTR